MSDDDLNRPAAQALLGRRGFTRLALLGGVGLMVPRVAGAQDALRLEARWVAEPDLRVTLYLRNQSDRGVELLASAIRLRGTLQKTGERPQSIVLTSEHRIRRSYSRMGFRIGERLGVGPDQEVAYDTFVRGQEQEAITVSGPVTLDLHAELAVDRADRPEAEHPGLDFLGRLRTQTSVVLSA